MSLPRTAIIHFSAPPVVGGVESVIEAHAREMTRHGYPLTIIAGRGNYSTLPEGVQLEIIPEMDSRHTSIVEISGLLQSGQVPNSFEETKEILVEAISNALQPFDNVIVHNVLTKRFNLPLTAAILHIQKRDTHRRWIAWCHDIDWVSPTSQPKLFPGYPWDLLREYREDIHYVTVSIQRQMELANLYGCPEEIIKVIYNGVDPQQVLGLNPQSIDLINRLGLWNASLILLMPVRITKAKNFEYAFSIVSALKNLTEKPRLVITGPPDPHDADLMDYYHSLLNLRKRMNLESEILFIFNSGPDPDKPYTISPQTVGDLYRISDILLMTSHREGFGMPILEAGLVGILIASAEIPAATEIGRDYLITIPKGSNPVLSATEILQGVQTNRTLAFKQQIRREFSWRTLFRNQIEPLINPPE